MHIVFFIRHSCFPFLQYSICSVVVHLSKLVFNMHCSISSLHVFSGFSPQLLHGITHEV